MNSVFQLSPVPWVDLTDIALPRSGLLVETTNFCRRKFIETNECRAFYSELALAKSDGCVACPFGFTAKRASVGGTLVAYTGFIGWPRRGGSDEKQRAEDYKAARFPLNAIERLDQSLARISAERIELVVEEFKHYSSALHEIRKVNRTIKLEAEKLEQYARGNLEKAERERVTSIFKSSELMSRQFDILDILANEELATLPLKATIEVYRIFDKCVRIFEGSAKPGVVVDISGSSPVALVCDKTFPILATVLIENAIKYSLPNTRIEIRVSNIPPNLARVSVRNRAPAREEPINIFVKGVRGSDDKSGHGFGLHLAQLVAKQHSTEIILEKRRVGSEVEYHFFFDLPRLNV